MLSLTRWLIVQGYSIVVCIWKYERLFALAGWLAGANSGVAEKFLILYYTKDLEESQSIKDEVLLESPSQGYDTGRQAGRHECIIILVGLRRIRSDVRPC